MSNRAIDVNARKLEERLNCFGYYGFGGGYNEALVRKAGRRTQGEAQLYCNFCDLSKSCWDAHRTRVQQLFPDLAKAFDQHADECRAKGMTPGAMMAAWQAKVNEMGDAGGKFVEPYSMVMLGNIEDGINVVHDNKPKDRKRLTLPWDEKKRQIAGG